jgi:hypothetical protein
MGCKRLRTITLPGTNPITITYYYFGDASTTSHADASNQVQNVIVTSPGNPGVTLTYLRDTSTGGNEGRLIEAESSANGGTFSAVAGGSPAFNQQDQIAGQTISQPIIGTIASQSDMWSYSYDSGHADALTNASDYNNHTGTTAYAYTYDGVGNRTGTSLGSANLVNEYSNLTYNQRGDLTSDGTYKYGYDALDRLISITPISPTGTSTQEQYGYDSQGRRLWKDVYAWNTTTSSWVYSYARDYVWDGNNLAAELDGSGNLVIRYIYGPTGLIAEQDFSSDPNYSTLLTATGDPSGQPVTIVAIADLSGNFDEFADARTGTILGEFRYDPWGNVVSAAGPATSLDGFRAKGYWVDAEAPWLGFAPQPGDNFPHVLNFALQIWQQRDQAGQSQTISVTGVPFNDDPVNKIDPDGLDPQTVTAQQVWNEAWIELRQKYPHTKYFHPDQVIGVNWFLDDVTQGQALTDIYSQKVAWYNGRGIGVVQPALPPDPGPSIHADDPETTYLRSKMDIDAYRAMTSSGQTFSHTYEDLDRQYRQLKQQEFYNQNGYSFLHQALDGFFNPANGGNGNINDMAALGAAFVARPTVPQGNVSAPLVVSGQATIELPDVNGNVVTQSSAQVQLNRASGNSFRDLVLRSSPTAPTEVHVGGFTDSGTVAPGYMVVDILPQSVLGDIAGVIETKLNPDAPLSDAQRLHLPLLQKNGGIVRKTGEYIAPGGVRVIYGPDLR